MTEIIKWLLEGDAAIKFQVHRDLLGIYRKDIQNKIAVEGWGGRMLSNRNSNGHWGDRFYHPKWISTHYTLLDLRNLNLGPKNETVRETIDLVLDSDKALDGGIRLGPSTSEHSDVCVNGMFLNYASYFQTAEEKLASVVDCILSELMPDGGFNCRTTRSGARHSSLHTTISVLEGLNEFLKAGNTYRKNDVLEAQKSSQEFILRHRLFRSDKSGEIISKEFLKLPYPSRWKYNILRALDYFRFAECEFDSRMDEALMLIKKKQKKSGLWNVQAAHPGKVHFVMEASGGPSRWNTLIALRVLKYFDY